MYMERSEVYILIRIAQRLEGLSEVNMQTGDYYPASFCLLIFRPAPHV